MSLNYACIFVEMTEPADIKQLHEIIDSYANDFHDKISKIEQSTLLENFNSYYLNRDLERELLLTPAIDDCVGIFENSASGTDPNLAQTISDKLGCKVIWLEFIEQTYSLLVYEFDNKVLKKLVHVPENYVRNNIKEFFRENELKFYEQPSQVFNYDNIIEILEIYYENSEIPAKLLNMIKTAEKTDFMGTSWVISNIHIFSQQTYFKTSSEQRKRLLHLDKFIKRKNNKSDNKLASINREERKISGVIPTSSAVERIFELEENWRKKIFFAFYMNADELYLPEVCFNYIGTAEINELIENERESAEFGYWQLTNDINLLTLPAFFELTTTWLKEVYPYLKFKNNTTDYSIQWELAENEQKMTAYIDNLYYKYLLKNSEQEVNKILAAHFDPVFKMPIDFSDKEGIDIDPGKEIKDYFDIRLLNENLLDSSFDNFVYQYYVEGIRAYIGFSTGYGTFRYIKENDLKKWGYKFETALDFALENIRNKFLNFEDHLIPIYDTVNQTTYFKMLQVSNLETGVVLIPEFTSIIGKIIGYNFLLGMPNRDFLYIYPESSDKFLRARKREIEFLYNIAPYPISADIMQIDETGVNIKQIQSIFS